VTSPASSRAFEVRHLQLARAVFAALAAVMVTFSPDHSAVVGLSVFSGFAIATGFVFAAAAWLVRPATERTTWIILAVLDLAAGIVAGIGPWRTTVVFFVLVIAWALATGLVETVSAIRTRRRDAAAPGTRDALLIGILTLVLGAALPFVPMQYALEYTLEEAGTFTLTGITIAVGVFGGYAAIVGVFLAIAGLSPRRPVEAVAPVGAPGREQDPA
jgi:uncharacterized membrane protein HdeD (DUF308 family)